MNLVGDMLDDCALRVPTRTALKTHDGLEMTYVHLASRSTRLAKGLLNLGLAKGDRLAVWLETCPQYIELYLAAAKAGLVIVPINSMFTKHEAEFILSDSGAKALFYTHDKASAVGELEKLIGIDHSIEITHWSDRESAFEKLLHGDGMRLGSPPIEDDLYVIAYTSGTTGNPKGAMVTHRSLMATLRQHAHSYRTPQGSVNIYHANMSFVASALGLVLAHFYVAGTVYLTGKVSPELLLDAISRERGTFVFVPSPWIAPMTELCRNNPEKWQSVKTFVHVASKADPNELRAWAEVIGCRYFEGYGMTETSGGLVTGTNTDDVVRSSRADDLWRSVGRPVVETVIRVVDSDGTELPRDGESIGELLIKSPSLVQGYWNRPEATASSFRDGWYHSGDLGAMDAAGYIYVADRRNDLIISGGMNIYPSELEQVLGRMDGVTEVAVVGVPHDRWGMTPVAFVVCDDNLSVDSEAVLVYCKQFLARYKWPSHVEIVDSLPRNASGKVLRRVLRERLTEPAPDTIRN